MAVKKGLGKGLSALIPEIDSIDKDEIKEVDIDKIKPNEKQPRKVFDKDSLNSLAESIKKHGVIQPIIVRKVGEEYQIVAGERRWRAAKIAGLKVIPAIIRDFDERELLQIALIENLQREDLNPIEEAEAYKTLIEEYKLTQDEVAKIVGKSRPAITNSLRLLNLDPSVREMVASGVLSPGHAKVLLSVENRELQRKIAEKIVKEDINVRDTEKLIKNLSEGKGEEKKKLDIKEPHLREMEENLERLFGTKVRILKGKKKGRIEIEYYSDEELERILEFLSMAKFCET